MKRKVLFIIIIVMGFLGYWVSLNTWIFKSDSDVNQYKNHLIQVGEWEQVNLSPSFNIFLENIIEFPSKVIVSIRTGYSAQPKSIYFETITFKKNGDFFREGGMSPSGEGLWILKHDVIDTRDDNHRGIWGGSGWFKENKEIIKLTDRHLILYYDGYYYEYTPKIN